MYAVHRLLGTYIVPLYKSSNKIIFCKESIEIQYYLNSMQNYCGKFIERFQCLQMYQFNCFYLFILYIYKC